MEDYGKSLLGEMEKEETVLLHNLMGFFTVKVICRGVPQSIFQLLMLHGNIIIVQ